MTGETAQGVEQIARAAEDLNRLTENLQQLLGRFKLKSDAGQHAAPQPYRTSLATPTSHIAVRANGKLVQHDA